MAAQFELIRSLQPAEDQPQAIEQFFTVGTVPECSA